MVAKEAAEIAGMSSRALTGAIDRYGSDLSSYGRKPGRKQGAYTKENYLFLKAKRNLDCNEANVTARGELLDVVAASAP